MKKILTKQPIRLVRNEGPPEREISKILHFKNHTRNLFHDWKQKWSETRHPQNWLPDILAAITVAAVALPLNIALAIACGLPAQAGLLAGAIGGTLAAIFGGAPLQVTGPSAAVNVIVLALAKDFGVVGVAASCLLVGITQLILSAISAGKFIRYVPEAVLAGFISGVGLKLLDQQIPELLGFNYTVFEIAQMIHQPHWLHHISWFSVVSGLFVAFLVISCKQYKRFPAALVGIALITYVSNHLQWNIERVGNLTSTLAIPEFSKLEIEQWFDILLASIPLVLLASIETLLSGQAIDRLVDAKKPYNSNLELLGQGLANIGTALVGGMPVSGVIVRSTVNAQSGGKSSLSSLLHAILLFVAIFHLNDVLEIIPLSALAGLLCVVAYRLIETTTLIQYIKTNKLEAVAFLMAAIGTLTGHLMWGLIGGILIHGLNTWFGRGQKPEPTQKPVQPGIRAVIPASKVSSKRHMHYSPETGPNNWLTQIRERAHVAASSFVHQKASIIGKVVLGEHVHIAAESSVRADEGSPFFIGSNSNIQDGVVIHALKEKWVHVNGEDWAVYIGENVSVAHQALVHGPCFVGNNSFIGFQAIVHDSTVGSHCYIGIGAIVVGVDIPDGRFVPHGMVVDSLEKAEKLPRVSDAHLHFNDDVVGVNKGLAAAYKKHSGQNEALKRLNFIQSRGWRSTLDRF